MFSNVKFFFFFENRAICEIMWKNIVEPDRPQMTIWRMRFACQIPKATYKHSECHTCGFSTATTVAQTRFSVRLYVHCLSCLCWESNHISTVAHPTYRRLTDCCTGCKYCNLTLRLLMSYIYIIYIYIYIYIYMEHLFLMFLDHTQRRTTVGRTPLDE